MDAPHYKDDGFENLTWLGQKLTVALNFFALITALFIQWGSVYGSVVQPSDVPYYRLRHGSTLYVYTDSTRALIGQLAAYNQRILAMYEKYYGWSLDEEESVILTSPRQQVANAYATVMPNIKTVWFPGGAGLIEYLAQSSWLMGISTHETAHLYQLNAKGPFNSFLKKIVRNPLFFPILLPVFIHPNILTPTFLLEGNAVLMESRLNMGGRLHNGEARALVYSQIAAGEIDPTRLINDELRFPFGEEPYLQGAYFQAHLASKYGIAKTNEFFKKQGDHYLWPLVLNKTFRNHFGASYPQEIREFTRNIETLAKNQKASSSPALIENYFVSPLNHDNNRIFFLSSDAKEPPVLYTYDKTTGVLNSKQIDLLMGKVFWIEGRPVTAASSQHDLHHLEYSLYGEHAKLLDSYRGQMITDQRAGKSIGLDGKDAWLDPQLIVNGEAYDISHSEPILDEKGDIYYFRQNGTERMIYKNREPIAKFQGFFSKMAEVGSDGTIYFIGSTDYGSSLFQWKAGEISRVLTSDRIIDARQISPNKFLIVEVGAHNRSVHVETANQILPQPPAFYSYGFENENLTPAPLEKNLIQNERPYNGLTELHYSSLLANFGYSSITGSYISGDATFTDPLDYHLIDLTFNYEELGDHEVGVFYQFSKWLINPYVGYLYQDHSVTRRLDDREFRSYDDTILLGASLPILRYQRWDAVISTAALRETESYADKRSWGALSRFEISRAIRPGLAYWPWRESNLDYINRLEFDDQTGHRTENTSMVHLRQTMGFPFEFFGTLSGNYAWAEGYDVSVDYGPTSFGSKIEIPRLTSFHDEIKARNAGSARLEFTKSFPIRGYSSRIPIGTHRIAPVLVGQGIFLDDSPDDSYPHNTFEWGIGADLDLLIFHKLNVRTRYLQGYDTRDPYKSEDTQVQFLIHETF